MMMLWNRWLRPELHHAQQGGAAKRGGGRRGGRGRGGATAVDWRAGRHQRRQQLGQSARRRLRQAQVSRRHRRTRVPRRVPGTHLSTWPRQQTDTGIQLRFYVGAMGAAAPADFGLAPQFSAGTKFFVSYEQCTTTNTPFCTGRSPFCRRTNGVKAMKATESLSVCLSICLSVCLSLSLSLSPF